MNKIILPLDNKYIEESYEIINDTHELVWGYKLRRQILDEGLDVIKQIKDTFNTKIMVDFKLYDIPSAMDESIKLHINALADITTVHCTAQYKPSSFKEQIAGVTILTSTYLEDFKEVYKELSMEDNFIIPNMVLRLSTFANFCNYGYVVCSGKDLKMVRSLKVKKIVPGIRPLWYQEEDDQKRTVTPKEAIVNGADLLVIGRPILNSNNIVDSIKRTNDEISSI